MYNRMDVGVQDLEMGAEGIVRRATVLYEHQIPSNIDESPMPSGPKRLNQSHVPRGAWCCS
jgi:hypothetical protein